MHRALLVSLVLHTAGLTAVALAWRGGARVGAPEPVAFRSSVVAEPIAIDAPAPEPALPASEALPDEPIEITDVLPDTPAIDVPYERLIAPAQLARPIPHIRIAGARRLGAPPPQPAPAQQTAQKPVTSTPPTLARDKQEPPRYPPLARRRGWEGTAIVRVRVASDGSVRAAELHKSSGYETLDREALRAAKRWRFRAGSRNGEPVEQWHLQPVEFRLR